MSINILLTYLCNSLNLRDDRDGGPNGFEVKKVKLKRGTIIIIIIIKQVMRKREGERYAAAFFFNPAPEKEETRFFLSFSPFLLVINKLQY